MKPLPLIVLAVVAILVWLLLVPHKKDEATPAAPAPVAAETAPQAGSDAPPSDINVIDAVKNVGSFKPADTSGLPSSEPAAAH